MFAKIGKKYGKKLHLGNKYQRENIILGRRKRGEGRSLISPP
jgi:hypothetical protein